MLEDTLENKIANRPPVEELQEKKIIFFAETVEVLPTFRKSEYNRKPDATATFKNLTQQMKVDIREELNNFKKEEMDIHPDSKSFLGLPWISWGTGLISLYYYRLRQYLLSLDAIGHLRFHFRKTLSHNIINPLTPTINQYGRY